MPVTPDITIAETPIERGVNRARTTLTVRAGAALRSDASSSATRRAGGDRASSSGNAALGTQNGVVPLKRLTAGRKEIKIAHDGATYLLRITKSNKLILTKAEAAKADSAT